MTMRQVRRPANPRWAWAVLFLGSLVVTAWAWGGLDWPARGVLLAAYGVAVMLVLLPPALGTRARLQTLVSAQGTVVGIKQIRSGPTGIWAVVASALGSPESDLELGRPVPVRYRPEDPEQAQVTRRGPE